MRNSVIGVACRTAVVAGLVASAHVATGQQQVIPLYRGTAPGSEGWKQQETVSPAPWNPNGKLVRNVVNPTLTVYLPKANATGTAIVVAPGGGFRFLAWDYEGTEVAEWLAGHGIAAFVLKYRTMDTGATEEEFKQSIQELTQATNGKVNAADRLHSDARMQKAMKLAQDDGRQAVKLVRQRAAQWGVAPDRIGIMGFSAGGMVTDGVMLSHTKESRPDFAAPIYGPPLYEFTVPADAPPIFIACADDDNLVPAAASARLYVAWHLSGKPAELHIYAKGGHGFGMTHKGIPTDEWIDRFGDWLKVSGFLAAKP
jgi:acetyl esterase/lipase